MDSAQDRRRRAMVSNQLERRGVRDQRVLHAMAAVAREEFVPPDSVESAYHDGALGIDCGQTISQPYIVALTLEALTLTPTDVVLDVGTGSGYGAAVMSLLAERVVSIERIPELASAAAARLTRLGYDNVEVVCGDGSIGWPSEAPYDAVCVSAVGPRIPTQLIEQLVVGGRLLMPVERNDGQVLVMGRRREDGFERREVAAVRFVPLLGAAGFGSSRRWKKR